MTEIPELTGEQLQKAIPARLRKRLVQGRFESGEDIVALRRFVGLTQAEFTTRARKTADLRHSIEDSQTVPVHKFVL